MKERMHWLCLATTPIVLASTFYIVWVSYGRLQPRPAPVINMAVYIVPDMPEGQEKVRKFHGFGEISIAVRTPEEAQSLRSHIGAAIHEWSKE